MAELGFTTYVHPAPPATPTLAERIGALTNATKIAILDGFANKIGPNRLKITVNIKKDLITAIYKEIDAIEEYCRTIMRGELLVTPAVIVDGVETTPAVYNTPPSTIPDLKAQAAAEFSDVFTVAEVGAVVDKLIEYAEVDTGGNPIGTALVYQAEVVK